MNAGKWITLHVIAEGKTEVQFVRSVLAPHLVGFRIKAVPHLIRTGPEGRGGGLDYQRVQRDASRLMKSDPRGEVFLTTMLDLYALPSDFPGTVQSQCGNNPYQRVAMLEDAEH